MILDKAKLPEGWRIVRLGDVAEVTFSTVDKKTIDGEVPVQLCNYTDVFYSRRIHPGMDFMSATASPVECERWVLKKGDVLFTKDSETPDEIGVPAYVSEALPNVLCGYHLGLARPQTEYVQGIFLAESLASRPTARQFARIANGVTRFGLTLSATRNLPILLPPLAEQRAIAAVLDSIDEAIERTEAVIAATKRLRDALLHELLTRGLPGQHTEFKQVLGVGIIPARWKVVRLGDVANVTFSSVDKKTRDDEIAVQLCNYTDVFYNRRIRTEMDFMTATATRTELERWSLKRGDVLFTKDSETPDEIGVPSVVTEDMPNVLCGYHLGLARPRVNAIKGEFLTEALRSQASRREFARVANGVTRFGLTLNATHSLPVVLPPFVEQCAIAGLLERADEVIDHTRAERSALQALKAAASEALLTGGVRVSCGTEIVH